MDLAIQQVAPDAVYNIGQDQEILDWSSESHPSIPTEEELIAAYDLAIAKGANADWATFGQAMIHSEEGKAFIFAAGQHPHLMVSLVTMTIIAINEEIRDPDIIAKMWTDTVSGAIAAGLSFSPDSILAINDLIDRTQLPDAMKITGV